MRDNNLVFWMDPSDKRAIFTSRKGQIISPLIRRLLPAHQASFRCDARNSSMVICSWSESFYSLVASIWSTSSKSFLINSTVSLKSKVSRWISASLSSRRKERISSSTSSIFGDPVRRLNSASAWCLSFQFL